MTNDPNSGGFVYDHAKRRFVPREEYLRSLLHKSMPEFSPEQIDDWLDNELEPEAQEPPFNVADFIESVKTMPVEAQEAYMSYLRPLVARMPENTLPTEQEIHEAHNDRVEELAERLADEAVLLDSKKRQAIVDELNILLPPVEAKHRGAK